MPVYTVTVPLQCRQDCVYIVTEHIDRPVLLRLLLYLLLYVITYLYDSIKIAGIPKIFNWLNLNVKVHVINM